MVTASKCRNGISLVQLPVGCGLEVPTHETLWFNDYGKIYLMTHVDPIAVAVCGEPKARGRYSLYCLKCAVKLGITW